MSWIITVEPAGSPLEMSVVNNEVVVQITAENNQAVIELSVEEQTANANRIAAEAAAASAELDATATAADRVQTGLDRTAAAGSASTASTQAGIATAQAGIATTKAGEASTSASTASTQAGIATTKASEASTSESNSLTSANNANVSAISAAASAESAAQVGTSTPLTGYVVGANTAILPTDLILAAFAKAQGQINARVSGSLVIGQVAFGSGVNTVGGDSRVTIVSGELTLGTTLNITASSTTGIFTKYRTAGQSLGGVMVFADSLGANKITFGILPASVGGHFVIETVTGLAGAEVYTKRFQMFNTTGNLVLQNSGTFTDAGFRLDVNGTVRIVSTLRVDSRANVAGNFATYSAAGVLQQRTAVQSADDILKSISGYNAAVSQKLEHTAAGVINWVNI